MNWKSKRTLIFVQLSIIKLCLCSNICDDLELKCYSNKWVSLDCHVVSSKNNLELDYENSRDLNVAINHFRLEKIDNGSRLFFKTHSQDSFYICEPQLLYNIEAENCSTEGVLNSFEIVKPDQVKIVDITQTTAKDKVQVDLKVTRDPRSICFKPFPLLYIVTLDHPTLPTQTFEYKNRVAHEEILEIPGLNGFTHYDISVTCKSEVAPVNSEFFAESVSTSFETIATAPPMPILHPSGFEREDCRNGSSLITLHWAPISPIDFNGPDFHYLVNGIYKTDKSFWTATVNNDEENVFSLNTVNSEGTSEEKRLVVPKWPHKYQESIRAVAFLGKEETTVIWASNQRDGAKMTIFYCFDQTKNCESGVSWTTHPAEIRAATLAYGGITNLFAAVDFGAKTLNGMEWIKCRINQDVESESLATNIRVTNLTQDAAWMKLGTDLCSPIDPAAMMIEAVAIHTCITGKFDQCQQDLGELKWNNTEFFLSDLQPGKCHRVKVANVKFKFSFNLRYEKSSVEFCKEPFEPYGVLAPYLTHVQRKNSSMSTSFLKFNLTEFNDRLRCRIEFNNQILEKNCSRSMMFELNPGSNAQIDSCPSFRLRVCSDQPDGGCSHWSKQIAIVSAPSPPIISHLDTSHEGKVIVNFTSSHADHCEAKIYDNIIREHARLGMISTVCPVDFENNCCPLRTFMNERELDLAGHHTSCVHYNISLRCARVYKLHYGQRGLYSEWSEWFSFQTHCTETLGVGELVGVAIGIIIATVIAALVVLLICIQICRFRERVKTFSQIEAGRGIPLSVRDSVPTRPFTDNFSDYQETSTHTMSTELSVPNYRMFTTFGMGQQPSIMDSVNNSRFEYQPVPLR